MNAMLNPVSVTKKLFEAATHSLAHVVVTLPPRAFFPRPSNHLRCSAVTGWDGSRNLSGDGASQRGREVIRSLLNLPSLPLFLVIRFHAIAEYFLSGPKIRRASCRNRFIQAAMLKCNSSPEEFRSLKDWMVIIFLFLVSAPWTEGSSLCLQQQNGFFSLDFRICVSFQDCRRLCNFCFGS